MFGPIKAIAVDDEPSHLLSITTGLSNLGIPCMGYWFDRDASELRPSPPDGGLPYLRILFTDLNLAELGGVPETQVLWSTIVTILKRVVSKESGPYLLVFWTRIGAKAAEVKAMLYDRADALDGVPCPIDVLELPKAKFLVEVPKGKEFDEGLYHFFSELHANIDQLRDALAGAVAADGTLSAVSSWETRTAEAAAMAVNEVHRCARIDEPDQSKGGASLTKVLAKISVAASGSQGAKAEPARALDAGMIDILVDQIGTTVDAPAYKATINAALLHSVSGEIDFNNRIDIHADLNTLFHIDRAVASIKTWDRGAVIPIECLRGSNSVGFKPLEVLTAEFLFPPELFEVEEREQVNADLKKLRSWESFVLVEVGAECDHAQENPRTRRYLVGLEIPLGLLHLAERGTNRELRNKALELLGPWKVDGGVKYLLISCRRFCVWQSREPPPGTPRYRLRSSLVDKLLHRYATWSSRPGIVEFR